MSILKKIYKIFSKDDTHSLEFQADSVELEQQPVPRSMRITYWLLLVLILFAFAWSCLAKVDKIVTTRGKLISTEKTIVVQPLSNSIIKKFHVEVGQTVSAGQKLVSLDPTFAMADEGQLQVRINALNALVARLDSEFAEKPFTPSPDLDKEEAALQKRLYDGRKDEFDAKLNAYRVKEIQLSGEIDSFRKRLVSLEKQLEATKEVLEMRRRVFDLGADAKISLLEAESRNAAMEAETESIKNDMHARQQQLAQTKSEMAAFVNAWRNDGASNLADARKERDSLLEQKAKAVRLSELAELICPVNAVVLEFGRVSVGSVVKEGDPIMTLMPLNTPLEAEVSILTSDIGYVKLGDPVRIKLDAYPFQRHGTMEGVLRVISEDALVKSQEQKEATYQGRVQLTNTKLSNVGPETHLLPGMTLTAEIVVGERRVITYLIYPLISGLDESIREP